MYHYEDYLMFTRRYLPNVKSFAYIYQTPKRNSLNNVVGISSSSRLELYYDKDGKIVQLQNFDSNEVCKFYYKGNLLVKIEEFFQDILKLINIIKYDSQGRILSEVMQEPKPSQNSKFKRISYNYPSPSIELINCSAQNFSYDYFITKYFNSDKELIEYKFEDSEEILSHYKIDYNDNGQIISYTHLENPLSPYVSKLFYNKDGLLKQRGENLYAYKFDVKGNWIEIEKFNEYGLYQVLKREIVYY